MNIKRTILILLFAIVAFAGGSSIFGGEASAQILPELSESEIEMIRNIVQVELTGKEPGTEIPWNYSETGNSGVVILRGISVMEGMDCRDVTHILMMAGEADRRNYNLTTCLQSDGTWINFY